MNQFTLSLQFGKFDDVALHRATLPRHKVIRWLRAALQDDAELTVRIVDAPEGQALNRDYRQKDFAPNVVSFDYSQVPVGTAVLGLCRAGGGRRSQRTGQNPGSPLRPSAGARRPARAGMGPR
jgi:probable rRNA maturation factor